jgi:hypothetical protein
MTACGPAAPTEQGEVIGADCTALVDAARRAASCDPELVRLADELERSPDELVCRRQARRLLTPPEPSSRVHSVYDGSADSPPQPLSETERAALRQLALPAILVISPDVPRQPGIPPTTIEIDGNPVIPDRDGRFFAYLVPGTHTLNVKHSDAEQDACLDIETCDRVELIAHGSKLASHERVSPGACKQPGLEVAATQAAE